MYSPKIEEKLIRKLYLLRMSYAGIGIKKPMTEMVRRALDEYIPKAVKEIVSSGGTIAESNELEVKK